VWLADGQRGPHRTVVASDHGASQIAVERYHGQDEPDATYSRHQNLVDQPLFVVVDEGIEKDREEMRVRHAQERAALEHVPERDALLAKQADEMAAFELRAAETNLSERQKRDDEALKSRQDAETAAFDKRAQAAPAMAAPRETDKKELDQRHKTEQDAQKAKHEAERKALEARKERVASKDAKPEPAPEPSFVPERPAPQAEA